MDWYQGLERMDNFFKNLNTLIGFRDIGVFIRGALSIIKLINVFAILALVTLWLVDLAFVILCLLDRSCDNFGLR